MKKLLWHVCLLSMLMGVASCRRPYHVVAVQGESIAMTAAYDSLPSASISALLAPYTAHVDSIMNGVVGKAGTDLVAFQPESPLSNLVADIMREAAATHGYPAHIGLMNMGGLRASISKGAITMRDVYQVLPFENTVELVWLKGGDMQQLFEEIAHAGGHGISGAQLTITQERQLVDATVNGAPISTDSLYLVATNNYLAEGNDGLTALTHAVQRFPIDSLTLRQAFFNHIVDCQSRGVAVTAQIENRITINP